MPTFLQPVGLDGVHNLDDAILVRLAANEMNFRVLASLPEKMFAAAKSDLKPSGSRSLLGSSRIEGNARENIAQQGGLPLARFASTPPAVRPKLVLVL